MSNSRKPIPLLCILCFLLLLPVLMGCVSAAVVTADPVVLEEESEDEDES